MSLSVSTLLLFILLSPGFLFRFYLNHKSRVRRVRVAPDALHAGLLLVIYSLVIHIVAVAIIWLLYRLAILFLPMPRIEVRYQANDIHMLINGTGEPLYSYAANHLLQTLAYLIFTLFVVYVVVEILLRLAARFKPFARLLYGPLYEMLINNPDIVTAFVLTNISHEGRRIMYSGYPREIGIRDGTKIDYVVLEAPNKFYLSLQRGNPRTNLASARQMDGLLFLDCDKIDNVHFNTFDIGSE
jgi:hypothetical protein